MNYDAIFLVYLGAVGSIFLLNAVQWMLSRDSIYGLFTFQTFLWLTNTAVIDWNLTDQERDMLYGVTIGLIHISYLELVDRLFTPYRWLRNWLRLFQLLLVAFVGFTLLSFVVYPKGQNGSIFQTMPAFYSGFVLIIYTAGIWMAAQRQDLVRRFFLTGSFFVLLNEARFFLFYSGLLRAEAMQQMANVVGTIYIGQLLSFTLCLVSRQQQLAVAQTRAEEQLVQDQLEAQLDIQRLKQEKMNVQMRALQTQVNPHFLFNSLNSLSSLIDDDPQRAGQFVNELSLVYRYLLRANDHALIPLASELEFIQSYYHLLKTRYGDGLALSVQVDLRYHAWLLPPLTLQLLVENAVKHNVTSAKRPLHIAIFIDERGRLTVHNALQRKTTRVLSNGVGLSTIAAQYQQFNQAPPVITNKDGQFIISLPLITPPAGLQPTN